MAAVAFGIRHVRGAAHQFRMADYKSDRGIEVEDECGGLPVETASLFRPFDQRGVDRSGLGLGLAYSRWAVEANRGRIYARTIPGIGCVFTVDLPRAAVPAVARA